MTQVLKKLAATTGLVMVIAGVSACADHAPEPYPFGAANTQNIAVHTTNPTFPTAGNTDITIDGARARKGFDDYKGRRIEAVTVETTDEN